MEYTIQKLAKLTGITTRTLRYYDEIGLLKPVRVHSSGYRIYGRNEINLLQQILFYRELGIRLAQIKQIVTSPAFDSKSALEEHHQNLLKKREQLDLLIQNVEKTILSEKGLTIMTDKEKFEGFKRDLIQDNEKQYGEEIREKYGEDAVNQSNQKLKNMTKEEYEEQENLSKKILEELKEACRTGDPTSEQAMKIVKMHKQWLCFYWKDYSKEAHANLAQMYAEDERFASYYDKEQPGCAKFLRDAIVHYAASSI